MGGGSLTPAMKRAVFLDRDGVLNKAVLRDGVPGSPETIEQLVIVPDALAALAALRRHGFRLIVVTNQPDIARGRVARVTVEAINDRIRAALPIDAVEMCDHDDQDNCECRKPKPGMLLRAAARESIALDMSYMVGDRWRDIEAGRNASCRTILIGDGCGERLRSQPDLKVATLREAVDWILAQKDKDHA